MAPTASGDRVHDVGALLETPSVAALVAADPAAAEELLQAHRLLALGFAAGDGHAAHRALWRLLRLDGPPRAGIAEDAGRHVLVLAALEELERGFEASLRRALVPPVAPLAADGRDAWFAEEVLATAATRLAAVVRRREAAPHGRRRAFDRHAAAIDGALVDRYADLARRAPAPLRATACAALAEAARQAAAAPGDDDVADDALDPVAAAVRAHGALLGRRPELAPLAGHLVVLEVAAQRLATSSAACVPHLAGARAASATRRLALLDGIVARLLPDHEQAESLARGGLEALLLLERGADRLLGAADR